MALASSFFETRFSQKQLKIIPMSSNKGLPWKFICGFAGSSSPWNSKQREKIYFRTRTVTRTVGKERDEGQQTLYFGCLAPHIRHLFVTNFHYDGNIRRHLEALNNQSEMRNLPTWYMFPIQSSTIHGSNWGKNWIRVPTALDFRDISACTWARAHTQAKLNSELNACFLLNEHGDCMNLN